jgi:hypothetical protein
LIPVSFDKLCSGYIEMYNIDVNRDFHT